MNILKIYNVTNYEIPINENDILSWSSFLTPVVKKTPVIFVEKQILDLFYPSNKKISLNEECLREFSLNNDIMEFDLKRCLREIDINSNLIAVGLFLYRLNYKEMNILEQELKKYEIDYSYRDLNEGLVLISPERIGNWTKKLNVSKKYTYLKVLFHEYAHSYFYTGSEQKDYDLYDKIIEEGLANYIVLGIFKYSKYKSHINKLILSQPLEYKTCYYYLSPYKHDVFYHRFLSEFYYHLIEIYDHFYYRYGLYKEKNFFISLWKNRYNFTNLLDFQNFKEVWAKVSIKDVL